MKQYKIPRHLVRNNHNKNHHKSMINDREWRSSEHITLSHVNRAVNAVLNKTVNHSKTSKPTPKTGFYQF